MSMPSTAWTLPSGKHKKTILPSAENLSSSLSAPSYDAFGNNSFSSADNAWAAFFGAPSSPWKTSSYDQYDRHNYNLPDAYIGKNETLAQTIDELIYTDETFYTTGERIFFVLFFFLSSDGGVLFQSSCRSTSRTTCPSSGTSGSSTSTSLASFLSKESLAW